MTAQANTKVETSDSKGGKARGTVKLFDKHMSRECSVNTNTTVNWKVVGCSNTDRQYGLPCQSYYTTHRMTTTQTLWQQTHMTNGEKNTTQHRMTTTHNDNNTDIVATDTHDKWREKHNSTQNDNNS